MNRKIPHFFLLLLFISSIFVSACGQRGPLYLPEKGQEAPTEEEVEMENEETAAF